MSAPFSHLIKSAVFTPAGGTPAAVTFKGLQDSNLDLTGTRHTWSGDDVATQQAQSMEDLGGQVTVETTDLTFGLAAGLKQGVTGALVVVYARRGPRGAATGNDLTRTYAEAMVDNIRESAPHRGRSSLVVTFGLVKADGGDVVAYS